MRLAGGDMGCLRSVVAPVLVAVALLCSCGGDDPLLLGYVGPLTGKYSDLGVQGRNGVRLAMEQFNDAGGAHGRPVKLLVQNDYSSADGTLQAFRDMATRGVAAVLGPMTSGQAIAAWPVMRDFGGVVLSPTVATPSLSRRKDFFYRVIATNENWAEALAQYARYNLQLYSVLCVGDLSNADYVDTFTLAFARRFETLGGKIVGRSDFRLDQEVDWTGFQEAQDRLNPDALLVVTSARDAAEICRMQIRRPRPAQILGPTWPASRELLFTGGPAVEGAVFATGFVENSASPAQIAFEREYQDRYGYRPNFAAAYSYEAARVLLGGMSAGAFSPEDFDRYLGQAGEFEGVYGKFRFDAFGDVLRATQIIQVKNGEFVEVE
ncbi:MAG: ABC transporter substrate-binding protein [Desulfovibrio sp.]